MAGPTSCIACRGYLLLTWAVQNSAKGRGPRGRRVVGADMTPEELQFYFLFSADKPCYAGGHKGTRRRGKTRSPYDTAFISIGRTGYPSKPIHICQFSSTRSPQIF